MNVLLTCLGRSSYSVEIFKEAVGNRGLVFGCDCSADAPALQKADKALVVPRVDHQDYLGTLFAICDDHHVGLLVPALEHELLLLAMNRPRFLSIGTVPLVSPPEVTATCFDKLATYDFLSNCGLLVPHTFESLAAARTALARGDIAFPLVVKPRRGVSSIGTHCAEDDEELELFHRLAEKEIGHSFLRELNATDPQRNVLIQERLLGEEYGMDVVNDLNGNYVCTFVKRKIRMRAGQTDRAVTVQDDRLEMIGQIIGEKLGHIGLLDCDAFITRQGCYVIDMNPRIGGGYPFSHIAGANLPAALIAWASGQTPEPAWLNIEPNVTASRCDDLLVTNCKSLETARPRVEQELRRMSLKA
jgi:carbamoyl-phosphate synthase large subunit